MSALTFANILCPAASQTLLNYYLYALYSIVKLMSISCVTKKYGHNEVLWETVLVYIDKFLTASNPRRARAKDFPHVCFPRRGKLPPQSAIRPAAPPVGEPWRRRSLSPSCCRGGACSSRVKKAFPRSAVSSCLPLSALPPGASQSRTREKRRKNRRFAM